MRAMLQALSEIQAIGQQVKGGFDLVVIHFDTAVKHVEEFSSHDIPNVIKRVNDGKYEFKGRGGTNFNGALNYAGSQGPDALIIITDGYPYQNDWGRQTVARTFWLITHHGAPAHPVAPWG